MPYKLNPLTGNFDYYEVGSGSQNLSQVLTTGNSAGLNDIDMNNNDLLNVANINGIPYPPTGATIVDASGVTYDNISSGLVSTNVQGAIDELNTLISGITETQDLSAVLVLGNNAGSNDINLNNNDLLNVDKIDFNLATIDTAGEGQFAWNNALGTLNLGLKGGNTTLNVGQQIITRVVNKTTPLVPLTKAGYQVVIVAGATGQRLSVKLAKADNDANSAGTLGIVCENIAVNQEGFIVSEGQLTGINTTGSLQGETWNDGDLLYLSPTTFGAITNIKPSAPFHEVRLGYVEYAHNNNGKIYVKIDNGYEIDELHNVSINPLTVANNQGLFYTSATQLWENKTVATALGYTPLTDARTITINGSAQNLTADRTFTVTDANLSTSDITTNDVSTSKHGFVPKATSNSNGAYLEINGTGTQWVGIIYTIELIDVLTVDFYAPYDMKINSVTNIKNSPTTTLQDDGVAYTLTNTILLGSKVTVTVNTAGVVNLNITKA